MPEEAIWPILPDMLFLEFYFGCIMRCVRNVTLHSELNNLPGIKGKREQTNKGRK